MLRIGGETGMHTAVREVNKGVLRLHLLPTLQRCPMCLGRGTNSRGSLCSVCHGNGEISVDAKAPERVEIVRHNKAKQP